MGDGKNVMPQCGRLAQREEALGLAVAPLFGLLRLRISMGEPWVRLDPGGHWSVTGLAVVVVVMNSRTT